MTVAVVSSSPGNSAGATFSSARFIVLVLRKLFTSAGGPLPSPMCNRRAGGRVARVDAGRRAKAQLEGIAACFLPLHVVARVV